MIPKFLHIIFLIVPTIAIAQGNSADSSSVVEWLTLSKAARSPDNALQFAQKALALAESLRYENGIASSHVQCGNAFLAKKDYVRALEQYDIAKALLKRLNDDVQLGRVLKLSGDCFAARSYFRQSFDSYREAIPLARKIGDGKLLSECQEAMGNLSLNFGQTQNAITQFKRLLGTQRTLNDSVGVLTTTSKIARAHLSLMEYDSALHFNTEVQRLAAQKSDQFVEAAIDQLVILSFLKKFDEASKAKTIAEQLVAQIDNAALKARLLAATSNFYLALKDKPKADAYFDSAAALIRQGKSPELAISGLTMLAEMSRQNEDYKTAYGMLKQADKYKDIFRTENIERASAEIRNASEAALKEKEIEFLSRENTLKAEKLKKETELRRALMRQGELKDSSLERLRQLHTAKEVESNLRAQQLAKEKELRMSLSRENELKQHHLDTERKNTILLWLGIISSLAFGTVIFFLYRKQRNNNATIQKQAEELKVLNKEIHHRVKNNLQVISSLLDLQSQSLNDSRVTGIMNEAIQRVQSMAFIHQNLYQGESVNSVNMAEYIRILADHLFHSYNIRPEKIVLHTHIENLHLHTDSAIPLGMILNELISNALKYAFNEKETGDIWVTVKRSGHELFLQVKDNGKGLPPDFDPENSPSFGFEIINAFAQKLRARTNIDGTNGTDVQLIIAKFRTAE